MKECCLFCVWVVERIGETKTVIFIRHYVTHLYNEKTKERKKENGEHER
jgi:hypothetical protein